MEVKASGSSGMEANKGAASVTEAMNRGKDAMQNAADDAFSSATADLQALRRDLNGLKDTVTKLVGHVGNEAMRSARDVSSALASSSADIASTATERGKSLASDLETMARRNPLGAIAGAVVIGVLIGMMGRRS
jgi:ElaB/YqjD/DUF883 family membrane-anchored ribosome-binding protein